MSEHHDQLVDHKTGSWERTRHATKIPGGPPVLDNRCGRCSQLINELLQVEHPASWGGEDRISVSEAERWVKELGALTTRGM